MVLEMATSTLNHVQHSNWLCLVTLVGHQLRGDRREVALLLPATRVTTDRREMSAELRGIQAARALALEVLRLHEMVLPISGAPHRVRVRDGDVFALLDRYRRSNEYRGIHIKVLGGIVHTVVLEIGDGLVEADGGRGTDGDLVGVDEEDSADGHDLCVRIVRLGEANNFTEDLEDHLITFVS